MNLKKLVLLSTLLLGMIPATFAQMRNTAHDFTGYRRSKYNPSGEVCIVCHAPHNTSATETPLWNHATTTQTFSVYGANGTGYDVHFTPGQPDGGSKLCLSCHDGVTAINSYGTGGGAPAAVDSMFLKTGTYSYTTTPVLSRSNMGTDLSNDHPVSFVYAEAMIANPSLRDTSYVTPMGHSIGKDMLDKSGKVQCTSCHDPHLNTTTHEYYLKFSNANSAMCMTCHNK